ncbi:hypothetical protein CRENBAI_016879 [Crenichthys baileyi]|uniref:Uncharacterized protein n=1 Tax=Crenichthys baileyi TaxID=28760 RepID=A0AAV9RXB7_9TELE
MKTSTEWQHTRCWLPTQSLPAIQVPFSSFLSIRSNRCTENKRATAAGWPKEKSLAQFLCSLPFHCKSNRHSHSALLSPDHSYDFGYSSESVLSPFVFEDNAHCLQKRELKESLNKITSQKEIRPFRGTDLIFRTEMKKLHY